MKITDVKVWLVQGIKYNWTLLKIYTDEGYTGVGEATNCPGARSFSKLPNMWDSVLSASTR